jgi:hypothetical protein
MKIKKVSASNKRKHIEIDVGDKTYTLPFSKLRLKPTAQNKISEIYVDKELAEKAITYTLDNGKEDSVPLDAFLDYNKDPNYLRDMLLHRLTVEALKWVKASGVSKNELIRRLHTSPSQLYRLLDTANYKKSIDEMLRLLAVLGCDVELSVTHDAVA